MKQDYTMNRMGNSHNLYQGDYKRVLCVCSAGLLRSPTIAWVLSNEPYNCNTRAVGIAEEYALIPIDMVHLEWADAIVCANDDHFKVVTEMIDKNPRWKGKGVKPVYNLKLPDSFEYRDPILVGHIKDALKKEGFENG